MLPILNGRITLRTTEHGTHRDHQNIAQLMPAVVRDARVGDVGKMVEQGGGAIVNTTSAAGLVAVPGLSVCVAAKHGVVGLTKTVPLEYAKHGIRVNAVCPGGVDTLMVKRVFGNNPQFAEAAAAVEPVGRLAQPAEIGEAAVWLYSNAASFVIGLPMAVDGGRWRDRDAVRERDWLRADGNIGFLNQLWMRSPFMLRQAQHERRCYSVFPTFFRTP